MQALQLPIEWTFRLPAYIGYGPHWPLAPEESKLLTEQLLAALDTLPGTAAKHLDRVLQFLERIFPWASLAATAYALTMPRVALTQQVLAERAERGNDNNAHPAGTGPAAAAQGNHDGGDAGAPGRVAPVVHDIFTRGE